MTAPVRLAIVGMGKIARDHHLPAIEADPHFELVACVNSHPVTGIELPFFTDIAAMAASGLEVDAVAICTPPQVRSRIALDAIGRGWHVFLEKPPAASVREIEVMRAAAAAKGVALFASWHSRAAAAVEAARHWLAERTILGAKVSWLEDVCIWHTGQDWLWQPGGFGVFDPGINALSIITHILPAELTVSEAVLEFPENRAAPIAARVRLSDGAAMNVDMVLDFRHKGRQQWDIVLDTDAGTMALRDGGGRLELPGGSAGTEADDLHGEYPRLYAGFAELVAARSLDVDVRPLQLVADIFLRARLVRAAAFVEEDAR